MSLFEISKRKRNLREGYPETKGLKDGHCNRGGCCQPLAGRPQFFMTDHETFTDERLYYCPECADQFNRWDKHNGTPMRCTYDPET